MRKLILFCSIILLTTSSFAQRGMVDCSNVVTSKILDRDMPYSVFLPAGYETSNRSYPVMYLLHGMWGAHSNWVTSGEVNRIASEAINCGAAPEMIIIMPEGLTDAFYINNYDESVRWEDFFYKEFIPAVEKEFRIDAKGASRAIAGLSMGGYGSLYHAITHKDMFKVCYALSAAVIEMEPVKEGETASDFNKDFGLKTWGPLNEEGLPENYKAHSIQEIVKAMEAIKAAGPKNWGAPKLPAICIDCGDDDFLLKQNTNLVHLMKGKNIPFEFRVRDGGHNWEYWRTGLDLALTFIGDSFRN